MTSREAGSILFRGYGEFTQRRRTITLQRAGFVGSWVVEVGRRWKYRRTEEQRHAPQPVECRIF